MTKIIKCPIWGTRAELLHDEFSRDMEHIRSPRAGGDYVITREAKEDNPNLDPSDRIKLTTWIVDQHNLGDSAPRIASNVLEEVKLLPELDVTERQDRLLLYLKAKTTRLGLSISMGVAYADWTRPADEMAAWSASNDVREVEYLIEQLEKQEFIDRPPEMGGALRLIGKGFERIRELQSQGSSSSQAFVAMWFHESMEDHYHKGFFRAITEAGYKPVRIDRKEHINKIDDEIIAEIRRSRFLIADFTCEPGKPRGGVYFEAGFAHGLKIPVIWTCRDDVFGEVHFDTRQYNHIVWKDAGELCEKLKNRIAAVIGDGPLRKPS